MQIAAHADGAFDGLVITREVLSMSETQCFIKAARRKIIRTHFNIDVSDACSQCRFDDPFDQRQSDAAALVHGFDRQQGEMRLGVAELGDGKTGDPVLGLVDSRFGNQYAGFAGLQGACDPRGMPCPATQPDFDQATRHHGDLLDIATVGQSYLIRRYGQVCRLLAAV